MSANEDTNDRKTLLSSTRPDEPDVSASQLFSSATSGLKNRFSQSVNDSVASLINAADTDPEPRAFSRGGTQLYSASADITRPAEEVEEYYEEYENNPIIATQIQNFALEVFEPGYWVEADNDKTEEEIEEFLENIGVMGSKTHVPLSQFGKQMVIQHEVRGTFMAEKVLDDADRHVALSAINPTTMEIYTKPGTNVLLPPNHEERPSSSANIKATPSGEVAAFVQFDTQFSRWSNRTERRFAKDRVIHWPRMPDIGDQFGHSRIETVYERSRALREKLQDNDLAIAMKAWPMVLFQLGSEENPWTRDQMEEFMQNYEEEQLGPGMYQGVPGDVDVMEFAGETADINEHVREDINFMVSGMPGPKHALGAYSQGDDNESVAGVHERQFRKIVRAKRRDIEALLTPYLRDVARSWGYDPSGLELNIGRPDGHVAPEDVQGSIIRYQSDADTNKGDISSAQPGDTVDGSTVISQPDPKTKEEIREDRDQDGGPQQSQTQKPTTQATENSSPDRPAAHVADTDVDITLENDNGTAELADPRLVGTTDLERRLSNTISSAIEDARADTINQLARKYDENQQINPEEASYAFADAFKKYVRDDGADRVMSETLGMVRERTEKTLRQETHYPHIDAQASLSNKEFVDDQHQRLLNDLDSFGWRMADQFRNAIRNIDRSDDISAIEERVMSTYDTTDISHRATVMARMTIQELINQIKLTVYEHTDEVRGVKVISRCTDSTSDITADLAGCDGGQTATAVFDSETRIGEQLQNQTPVTPDDRFNPLPDKPPFTYTDTAEFGPVYTDDTDHNN
jgi:hypothetical protein